MFASVKWLRSIFEGLRNWRNYRLIAQSEYFDAQWYLKNYPDVAVQGNDVVAHYLSCGWKEGKDPCSSFTTRGYLAVNPDVRNAGLNPLVHYEKHGKIEGRQMKPREFHFPAEAANEEFVSARELPVRINRLVLFSAFSEDGRIHDYVVYYLRELRKVCDAIIFISDNSVLEGETDKIKDLVIYAKFERHQEYDFGSYKRGYAYAHEIGLLERTDSLVLCNDSCYGPVFPLSRMFETMGKRSLDFWGVTAHSQFNYHLQSYFLVLRPRVFNSDLFKNFLMSVKEEECVMDVIVNYEAGLTRVLRNAGFSCDSFVSLADYRKNARRTTHLNMCASPIYLMRHGCPFVKVKAIQKSGSNCEGVGKTMALLRMYNPMLADMIPYKSAETPETEEYMRVLVVLHLFYCEEWKFIAKYLATFEPLVFDLKVTVTDGHYDEQVLSEVRAMYPVAEIIKLPNRGYDVAPFIHVLNQVDLSQYDVVYKLQSKSMPRVARYAYGQVFVFRDWFLNLYRGVFGRFRTHRVLHMFKDDPMLGLVAARNLIIEDPIYKREFTKKIALRYNIKIGDNYHYVAGTCFAVRAECLQPIKNLNLKVSDFEQTERGEFSMAHAFERIICACVESGGYTMKGLFTFRRIHLLQQLIRGVLSPQRLLSDDRFEIDHDFFYRVLENRKLLWYRVVRIRLDDIRRLWDDGKSYSLAEVPPFRYLSDPKNGASVYDGYCRANGESHGFDMNELRFKSLIDSIEHDGFDQKKIPVITRGNFIMDGQHRCCILLHKYGPDYEVTALKVWLLGKSLRRSLGKLLGQIVAFQKGGCAS